MDTSLQAYTAVKPAIGELQASILNAIKAQGKRGATANEIELALGSLRRSTVSARFSELKELKLIVDSGERRKTESGKKAAVYIVADGFTPDQGRLL